MAPVREKMLDLQKEGKISIISFTWGFKNKEGVFLTIEFEINETRNRTRSYICRTLTGKITEGCVIQALAILNDVK